MDERRVYCLFQSLFHPKMYFHASLIDSSQLETDEMLLIPKSRAALERYGHQIVIGNNLNTRKYQVLFVSKRPRSASPLLPDDPPASEYEESWLRLDNTSSPISGPMREIEEGIVAELVKRHTDWTKASA
jgi:phosphopantothenate-cysteine ligase